MLLGLYLPYGYVCKCVLYWQLTWKDAPYMRIIFHLSPVYDICHKPKLDEGYGQAAYDLEIRVYKLINFVRWDIKFLDNCFIFTILVLFVPPLCEGQFVILYCITYTSVPIPIWIQLMQSSNPVLHSILMQWKVIWLSFDLFYFGASSACSRIYTVQKWLNSSCFVIVSHFKFS